MIHINRLQYAVLTAFTIMVKKDLLTRNATNTISTTVQLMGQHFEFCNVEIKRNSYQNLVKIDLKK